MSIWSYFSWDDNGHAHPWPDHACSQRKARRQINSQRSIKGHSTRIKNAVAKALSVFGDRYGTKKA